MLTLRHFFLFYFEQNQTPLTSFFHSSLSLIIFISSSLLKQVFFLSWYTYVLDVLCCFHFWHLGPQKSTLFNSPSFLLQMCQLNSYSILFNLSLSNLEFYLWDNLIWNLIKNRQEIKCSFFFFLLFLISV